MIAYGFATASSSGQNFQDEFFKAQSVYMNDFFFLMNTADREKTKFLQ